ncbi:MAG TPA: FHA domain-containing protein [Solirubrobacterales bacterium]
MSADGRSSGIEQLAGILRLRIVAGDAHFAVPGASDEEIHPREVDIGSPGATIGCGMDVDYRLDGPGTRGVSRRHLLLQPAGRQWTVTDCSKNGSRELVKRDRGQEWRRLQQDLPAPVTPGMHLKLGPDLELKLTPVHQPLAGLTTATDDSAGSSGAQIASVELERIARALLVSRRPGGAAIDPIPEIAADLYMSPSNLYKKIKLLGALPAVKPLLVGKPKVRGGWRPQDVAEALAIAFPYLTAPGSPD